jgi:lipopolysaccharide assembly outer membrane protein LptD (OstA)
MGVMEGVDGIFYQQGKPADHFSAPKVIYDEHAQTVTASGGVKLKSLTQNNTTLSCDSLVWYPGTGKLVGSGNVVYHSGHFMQTGPSFQADTKLKRITMHRTASQPIHIVYQP